VVVVLGSTLLLSWFLGSRTRRRRATDQPFESGIVSVGSADELHLSVEFYLVAMLFVIFEVETIFIFAWAVALFDLGWRGYLGSAVFIVVLLAALVYEWRIGALDWGLKRPVRRGGAPRGEPAGEPG
jgi:NADH-quinone oxidoreductase subunit A